MAVEIFGGVERIVGFGDVAGENGGVKASLIPFAMFQSFSEFCAVDADLPWQQTC